MTTRRGFFARLAGLFLAPVAAKVAAPRDEVLEALEGMGEALAATEAGLARRYGPAQTFLQNFGPIVQQHPEAFDREALARQYYREAMEEVSGRVPGKRCGFIRIYRDKWGNKAREDWYDYEGDTPPWRRRPTFAELCKRGVL